MEICIYLPWFFICNGDLQLERIDELVILHNWRRGFTFDVPLGSCCVSLRNPLIKKYCFSSSGQRDLQLGAHDFYYRVYYSDFIASRIISLKRGLFSVFFLLFFFLWKIIMKIGFYLRDILLTIIDLWRLLDEISKLLNVVLT